MKTPEEIVARIIEVQPNDWLGTQQVDLVGMLPFEHAKQFLKPEIKPEGWKPNEYTRESIVATMLDYMPFAWDKANNCRGISAGRSMEHYSSWVWLAGDDLGDLTEYEHYGKENLIKICELYGWDHTQWDDGERTNG